MPGPGAQGVREGLWREEGRERKGRAISCFKVLSSPETTGFLHNSENVLENVTSIRVLFFPLSPPVFPLFMSLFLLFNSIFEAILKCS